MGIKISTLKQARNFVAAAVLVATSAPFGPLLSANVYADEPECIGVHSDTEMANSINAKDATINLCDDITWSGNINYNVDINLNEHIWTIPSVTVLTSGNISIHDGNVESTANAFRNDSANLTLSEMTITSGDGHVNVRSTGGSTTVNSGLYSATGNAIFKAPGGKVTINDGSFFGYFEGNVEVKGGEFDTDPIDFVADGLDSYHIPEDHTVLEHWLVGPEATMSANDIVVPSGERAEVYRVSPADYNVISVNVTNPSGDPKNDVTIEEEIVGDEIVGYASTTAKNRRVLEISNNSGLSATANVKSYTIDGNLDDKIMAVGSTEEIEITTTKWDVDWALSSSNEEVVSIDTDGKTLVANQSGEAVVTVTFNDSNETTREFTVRTYDLNTDEEVVLIKNNKTAEIITDSNWDTAATVTSGDVELTDNDGSYTIKGLNAGLSTVEFSIDLDGDQEVDATKNVKVYVFEVNGNELVVEKGDSIDAETINDIFVKNSDDVELTVKQATIDSNIVENDGQGGLALTAVGAGDTTVTYRMSVADKHATMKLKVHVWNFVTEGMEEIYDLGNEKTSIDAPFAVYDENENAEISYTVKDANGEEATDVVVEQDGDEYSIRLADGARGGEYTIEFVDTFMGEVRDRAQTTVRVHEITITGDTEHYIVMSRNQFSSDNYYDVKATSNYAANRDITSSIDGMPVGGLSTEYRHLGNWRIRGNQAGNYTVTFTDGFASATIKTYVLRLTFGQDSYHVGVDEGYQFIYAYNQYWQEDNRNNNRTNTELTIVRDETGEVVAQSKYDFGTRKMTDGDRYKFEFCNEESEECLEAGNYTIYFNAYANGEARATKSVRLHLYEMVTPEYDTRYVYVGNEFEIDVYDKNNRATISAEVYEGDEDGISFESTGWFSTDYTQLTAEKPGVYTVRYYDYMGNGDRLDYWDVRIVVVEVEEETLLVRKGDEFTLTGSSAWTAEFAVDDNTGIDDYVFEDDKATVDSSDMETGEHIFYIGHEFDEFDDGPRPPRMDIKETTVYIYEIKSDETVDPNDETGSTIQDILDAITEEGLADDLMESNFYRLLALSNRDDVQAAFGDGFFEAFVTLRNLRDAIKEGQTITTKVEVYEYSEDEIEDWVEEDLRGLIEISTADGVRYYDIYIEIFTVDEEDPETILNFIGYLHELNGAIAVEMPEIEGPAEGYSRSYIVARKHGENEPEILAEGTEEEVMERGAGFFVKNGRVNIVSNLFSNYAVAYNDTLIPITPDTGVFAVASFEGDNAMSATVTAMLAMFVASALSLVGAAVFAKRR